MANISPFEGTVDALLASASTRQVRDEALVSILGNLCQDIANLFSRPVRLNDEFPVKTGKSENR